MEKLEPSGNQFPSLHKSGKTPTHCSKLPPSRTMASQCVKCLLILYIIHTVTESSGEVKVIQHPLTDVTGDDPLEYKLTKLLDVHVGKNLNNFHPSFRDSIRSEVRNILTGLRNEFTDTTGHNNPSGSRCKSDADNDNNFQQLQNILKELQSDFNSMKKNISNIFSASSSVYQEDVQNFIYKSPVGVSFNSEVCSSYSSQHVNPTGLWKNLSHVPKSCKEIQLNGYNVSGIYKIQPLKSEKPFMVLCDMETRGGGWAHIQKRYDGSQDFFLNWREYKFGFGDLEREFWLGLENIYSLTSSEINELLVEIVDRDNIKAYIHYKAFVVGSEKSGYPLTVLTGYSGDVNDSLAYHVGSKFSTKDFDQDENNSENCAETYSGAWWYNSCYHSNLNGKYRNADLPKKYEYQGILWHGFNKHGYSHSKSRMLVRPAQ